MTPLAFAFPALGLVCGFIAAWQGNRDGWLIAGLSALMIAGGAALMAMEGV